ncbi:MAG: guanylate kinase [Malacoplasma sp.]
MRKKGLIIIISGPSGVGKKTLIDQFINDSALNLVYSISMTTRKARELEKDGVDYFFVDDTRFVEAVNNNELIEWAEFAKNKYGTPLRNIYNQINNGKNVILEIEVIGATLVKEKLNRNEFISIFIVPPSLKELKSRLETRNTETPEKIEERIKRAEHEIKLTGEYDYVVLNDCHERAAKEMKEIIVHEISKK